MKTGNLGQRSKQLDPGTRTTPWAQEYLQGTFNLYGHPLLLQPCALGPVPAPRPQAHHTCQAPVAQHLCSNGGCVDVFPHLSQFVYSVPTIASFFIPEPSGPLRERLVQLGNLFQFTFRFVWLFSQFQLPGHKHKLRDGKEVKEGREGGRRKERKCLHQLHIWAALSLTVKFSLPGVNMSGVEVERRGKGPVPGEILVKISIWQSPCIHKEGY